MIHLLDNLLRQILIEQAADLTDEAQVRFQPPDLNWRTYVTNLVVGGNSASALNIYLLDLRENRKLRSNERVRSVENGVASEEPAPVRLDCHYVISAWSPAAPAAGVEPTLDEHMLLYQAAAVLIRNASLNPARVYPADSLPLNAWPAAFRNVELPTVVLPVEGLNKLAEFWSGMGQGVIWRPILYLIVTLPVALATEIAGPIVTTRITDYHLIGKPESAEVWMQIGGTVTKPNGDPVVDAWVRLETPAGEELQTTYTQELPDKNGIFTFLHLQSGNYRLRVRVRGFNEASRDITVPSPTGEYDVKLT